MPRNFPACCNVRVNSQQRIEGQDIFRLRAQVERCCWDWAFPGPDFTRPAGRLFRGLGSCVWLAGPRLLLQGPRLPYSLRTKPTNILRPGIPFNLVRKNFLGKLIPGFPWFTLVFPIGPGDFPFGSMVNGPPTWGNLSRGQAYCIPRKLQAGYIGTEKKQANQIGTRLAWA